MQRFLSGYEYSRSHLGPGVCRGKRNLQILAGIAQYYEPEKLVGWEIMIIANLAARKVRGLESNGMLLAATLEGGAPVLAGFLEDGPLGARLK